MAASTSPIDKKHPLYGWTSRTEIDISVADGTALTYDSAAPVPENLISSKFPRNAGLHRVGVFARIPAGLWIGAATNKVNLIIEGSNDGVESVSAAPRDVNDHWATIAELDINEYFDGTGALPVQGQIRLLGQTVGAFLITEPSGSPDIDVQRFKYLRVRAEVVVETAPLSFSMDVLVQGFGGDCEFFERNRSITYAAGSAFLPTLGIRTSDAWERPAGTRFMTVQAVVSDILLDGGVTGVATHLQGAFDVDGPYFNIASLLGNAFTTANESRFFQISGREMIDMDPFRYFRFLTFFWPFNPPGVPGAGTRYTMDYFPVFDGNDVVAPDAVSVSSLERDLAETFVQQVAAPGAQSAPGPGSTMEVQCQVLDIGGRPIRDSRPMLITVSSSSTLDGIQSPSATVSITAVTIGTLVTILSPTAVLVITNEDGIASVTTTNAAAQTTAYVHFVNYVPNQGSGGGLSVVPGQVLIAERYGQLQFV